MQKKTNLVPHQTMNITQMKQKVTLMNEHKQSKAITNENNKLL